jgi:transketolase
MGWEQYVGAGGDIISVTDFGVSAPGGTVMKKFGFTSENIAGRAMDLLK